MPRQDHLETLDDLLSIRPFQFCLFLAALFGEKQMETWISSPVEHATKVHGKVANRG